MWEHKSTASASQCTPSMSWKTPEARRQLLLQLKDAAKLLTPYAHKRPVEFITNDTPEVEALLVVLEQVLLHGIKIIEFNGTVPLWAFLERLEVQTPPCLPLRSAVGAVACIDTLRTPLAKARGWLRQSLNTKCLDESMSFIMNYGDKWLQKFYYDEAILADKGDSEILVC